MKSRSALLLAAIVAALLGTAAVAHAVGELQAVRCSRSPWAAASWTRSTSRRRPPREQRCEHDRFRDADRAG
ncbi:MAG TPA: hypothetical protein VES62_12020 [Thermoleophilaceae bacterium]|nr:hypothetical protein [Thermoleophilaceae bacterium]